MNPLPTHVAIIPDGNHRWAQKQGLFPVEGYRAGLQALERIADCAQDLGIPYLTAYLTSLENLNHRSAEWLETFFSFASNAVQEAIQSGMAQKFHIRVIGDLTLLPRNLRLGIEDLVKASQDRRGLTLTVAVAYTGRDEIVRAANRLVAARLQEYKKGGTSLLPITEDEFAHALDLQTPAPDLLIRSAGEQRLSGFLLWHLAYTEFAFADELWPDFTPERFQMILDDYRKRVRNFGRERAPESVVAVQTNSRDERLPCPKADRMSVV